MLCLCLKYLNSFRRFDKNPEHIFGQGARYNMAGEREHEEELLQVAARDHQSRPHLRRRSRRQRPQVQPDRAGLHR